MFFLCPNSVYCRPIIDEIKPPLNSLEYLRNGHSCVRYLHIAEVPDQYSIGIFVFGPYARIPLHDHPDMCVLSRVLYGELQRQSLDLARESDILMKETLQSSSTTTTPTTPTPMVEDTDAGTHLEGSTSSIGSWSLFSRGSWFNSSRTNIPSIRISDTGCSSSNQQHSSSVDSDLPRGSKYAYRNGVDHLEAPAVTVLYPYEGNFHEFVAGEHGAAVLDVLLPPYDNEQNRDCTFFNICANAAATAASKLAPHPGQEPCLIIPTGQPETFHCISGTYRDLGEDDDDDDEEF
jgi:PCO_ADO